MGWLGPGLLLVLLEKRNIFELSHLTGTASRHEDGWIAADWSQLFIPREPTLGNDVSKSFDQMLRQLVYSS